MSVKYHAQNPGANFGKDALVGTFTTNSQLVISLNDETQESAIARFACLPDDFVLRGDNGSFRSVGQIRKSLRDTQRHPNQEGPVVALPGCWPNLPDGIHGLLPLSTEESAEHWLVNFLNSHTEILGKNTEHKLIQINKGHWQEAIFEIQVDQATINCSIRMIKTFSEWEAHVIILEFPDKTKKTWTNTNCFTHWREEPA